MTLSIYFVTLTEKRLKPSQFFTVCSKCAKHRGTVVSLQNFHSFFPIMHDIFVWLRMEKNKPKGKKNTVIALLHQTRWKWLSKCDSASTHPFRHSSHLPPQSNLNRHSVIMSPKLLYSSLGDGKQKTQTHKNTHGPSQHLSRDSCSFPYCGCQCEKGDPAGRHSLIITVDKREMQMLLIYCNDWSLMFH